MRQLIRSKIIQVTMMFMVTFSFAFAQLGIIGGTIIDPLGNVWSGATVTAVFQPAPNNNGPYTWSGGILNKLPTPVTANSSGVFSITLPTNTSIVPSGSQWAFSFCPSATTQCSVFNYAVTGNADISALITSQITNNTVNSLALPLAYNTNQLPSPPRQMGGLIYDTTVGCTKVFSGTSWSCIGANGGGPPGGPTLSLQYNNGGTLFGHATLGTDANSIFYSWSGSSLLAQGWNATPFINEGGTNTIPGASNNPVFHNVNINTNIPGIDSGGGAEWNTAGFNWFFNSWTTGINSPVTLVSNSYGTGDQNVGINSYDSGKCGLLDVAGEGCTLGFRTYWNVGGNSSASYEPMMMGTVVSTSTDSFGQNVVTVSCTIYCDAVGVGHPFVDASTAISATITGVTNQSPQSFGASSTLNYSGTTFPVDIKGFVVAEVDVPFSTQINQPVLRTIQLTGLASALVVGNGLTIGTGSDLGVGSGQIDRTTVQSVTSAFSGGAETITAYIYHTIQAGGVVYGSTSVNTLAGGALELTNYTTQSGNVPYMFQILGCTTTTSCDVSYLFQGTIRYLFNPLQLAVTTTKLYRAAKIVDSGNSCTFAGVSTGRTGDTCAFSGTTTGNVTFTVQASTGAFAIGNTVENPTVASSNVTMNHIVNHQSNPFAYSVDTGQREIDYGTVRGPMFDFNIGVVPGSVGQTLVSQGGQMVPPAKSINIRTFAAGDTYAQYLENSGWSQDNMPHLGPCYICIGNEGFVPGSTTTYQNLLEDHGNGHPEYDIRWTPSTGRLSFLGFTSVDLPPINGANTIYTGNITLGTGTSDSVTITGVTTTSKCSFSPTNATAAGLTSTTLAGYYTVNTNTFTLIHAATTASGASYGVICSAN